MGTKSYVDYCAVQVIPGKLKALKNLLKQKGHEQYHDLVEVRGSEVSFQGLDGCKIITYWYDGFYRFLKKMARFVIGRVELSTSCPGDEIARIAFKDGQALIELFWGEWEIYRPDDFIRGKE